MEARGASSVAAPNNAPLRPPAPQEQAKLVNDALDLSFKMVF